MTGYGSISTTLQREDYPIYFTPLNEIKLYGKKSGFSFLGDQILSKKLPPSSQLSRLQGVEGKYMNLGIIPGQDYKQDWQVRNTRSKLSNEKGRFAASSISTDRPPLITISNGLFKNKEAYIRNEYILKNQQNFQYLAQRPVYKDVRPIGM
jgi:hypothetical protein